MNRRPSRITLIVFLAQTKKANLPRSVGFTRVGLFVPAAIRISDAAQAIVVTPVAHDNIDLTNSMIRSGVNRFVLRKKFIRLESITVGQQI